MPPLSAFLLAIAVFLALARPAWPAPWLVPLDRESYNLQFELQAAAEEKSYQDVYRILTSGAVPRATGLVPDAKDPLLFQSLTASVELLVHRHPPLEQLLRRPLAGVDKLRAEQLIAQGNAVAVEGLAVQYHGMPIAAEAHAWLGDRLLSSGDFRRAIGHYREALATAEPASRPGMAARLRLASAMLGRNVGTPPREPVVLGDRTLAPGQFERLVGEMLRRHPAGSLVTEIVAAAGRPAVPPPPGNFAARPQGAIEGDLGLPGGPRTPATDAVDWSARQMAVAVVGEMMIVSNRFQATALGLADGKVRWRYGLGERQGAVHGWPLTPMRPLVIEKRVVVRMLPRNGLPELHCLDLAGGSKRWQCEQSGGFVSDPFVADHRLFAFSLEGHGQATSALLLAELDQDNGKVLDIKRVLEARGGPPHETCQAVAVGDSIVAVMAGTMFCMDLEGQVAWLRQGPYVPPSAKPAPAPAPAPPVPPPAPPPRRYKGRRVDGPPPPPPPVIAGPSGPQHEQPPLVVGNWLYVVQPATGSIECVHRQTGALAWWQPLPGLWRIVQMAGDRLIVQTAGGVLALDPATGRTAWRHDSPGMLDGYLPSGPAGLLLIAERQRKGPGDWYPVLVWLDAKTGAERGTCPLESLHSRGPGMGPLVAADRRIWCFAAQPDAGRARGPDLPVPPLPQRTILELAPASPAKPR